MISSAPNIIPVAVYKFLFIPFTDWPNLIDFNFLLSARLRKHSDETGSEWTYLLNTLYAI